MKSASKMQQGSPGPSAQANGTNQTCPTSGTTPFLSSQFGEFQTFKNVLNENAYRVLYHRKGICCREPLEYDTNTKPSHGICPISKLTAFVAASFTQHRMFSQRVCVLRVAAAAATAAAAAAADDETRGGEASTVRYSCSTAKPRVSQTQCSETV